MTIREKKFVVFTIFILALLATGLDGREADKRPPIQPNKQTLKQDSKLTTNVDKGSPFRLLPDVEVTDPRITRVSTELGVPGVEFPKDRLRFTATLKNSGLAPCPEGGSFYIQLTRNGEPVANPGATNLLGAPGSTYKYSCIDTIVHGQAKEINYKITVTPNFKEVTGDNNSATCMVNEGMIHGRGGADFAITEFTSSFVDGPAGRTFYFVVTVKNNSLVYPGTAVAAYIYVDTNEHKHIAMLSIGSSGTRLPDPTDHAIYTFGRKASEIPAGNYWVRVVLDIQVDYDPNCSNNTSSQKVLIKNTR